MKDLIPAELSLLAYVESSNIREVLLEAASLIEFLSNTAQVTSCQVKPYWKIPEYQGITLTFQITSETYLPLYHSLKHVLAAYWVDNDVHDEAGDRSAVWDHRMHGHCPLTSMRWMHLQYVQLREQ